MEFLGQLNMIPIREIVQQALTTGYLTVAAENQLRQLLKTNYDLEDLNAFISLQLAASLGRIRQESRELISNGTSTILTGDEVKNSPFGK